MNKKVELQILKNSLAICRLASADAIPASLKGGIFFCIVRTPDELSIVCDESATPTDAKIERGWRALRVVGQLDFNLTGILSSIANPLAQAKISIFAISTFDTDYILVKQIDLENACKALRIGGFHVGQPNQTTSL